MNLIHASRAYDGLLIIGDPHLEARVPGFRKDDYPAVILGKLKWALDYAAAHTLLPLVTGDIFNLPRNNPNWLLVTVLQLFEREMFFVYGNHDVHENRISTDDSLAVIAEAGRGRLLDDVLVSVNMTNGRQVIVGGSSWGTALPKKLALPVDANPRPFVVWLTHHDLKVPGYEDRGYIRPVDLPGIDMVVNGHIHRRLGAVQKGNTVWLTPGNIARRSRSDAARSHIPAVLRIDGLSDQTFAHQHVEVPHQPYDDVFHEAVIEAGEEERGSVFVAGLAELQARKTQTGEGLKGFLEKNLDRFEKEVADEIRKLAGKVTEND